jgi:hypothetical protein
MSSANSSEKTSLERLIDQRLDAIDRALLGLLPRSNRVALVAQVESMIHELAAANSADLDNPPSGDDSQIGGLDSGAGSRNDSHAALSNPFLPLPGGVTQPTGKKRSKLAVSAGVLGIVAISLLILTPITYAIVATIGEALNEIVLYTLLGGHVGAVALSGVAAVALGLVALIRFRKLGTGFTGHAWAIAGLCTGALPMFISGMIALVAGLQLVSATYVQTSVCPPVSADGPVAYMPPGPPGVHPAGYPVPYSAIPPEAMPGPAPTYPGPSHGHPSAGRQTPPTDEEPGRAFVRQVGDVTPADGSLHEDVDELVEHSRRGSKPEPQPAPQEGTSTVPPASQPAPAEPRPSPEGLQRP